MEPRYYYLAEDGKTPIPTNDVMDWCKSFKTNQVARDHVRGSMISTVFLGISHRFGSGPPILWESMVFDGPLDEWQMRYETHEQAMKGHQRLVRAARRANTVRQWFWWLFTQGGLKIWVQRNTRIGNRWHLWELRRLRKRIEKSREKA